MMPDLDWFSSFLPFLCFYAPIISSDLNDYFLKFTRLRCFSSYNLEFRRWIKFQAKAPTAHTPILLRPRISGKPASQGTTRHSTVPRLGDKDGWGWAEGHGGGAGLTRLATQGAWPAPCSPSGHQEAGNHRTHSLSTATLSTLPCKMNQHGARTSLQEKAGLITQPCPCHGANGLLAASLPRAQSSCVPVRPAHPPSSRKNAPPGLLAPQEERAG